MDEKSAQMAEQLRKNPAMLKSLMQSRDGQTLMRMLTQDDGGAGLRNALSPGMWRDIQAGVQRAGQAAARGDTSAMGQMVNQIMQSPEGAALVERINKAVQK